MGCFYFAPYDKLTVHITVARTNGLLKVELERNVLELGRERHLSEQYQKQLNAQSSSHKELVELLKNTQTSIVDDLTKEGGILTRLLTSDNTTKTK